MSQDNNNDADPRRRSVLRLAGAAAVAAPSLILGRQAWSAPRKLTSRGTRTPSA